MLQRRPSWMATKSGSNGVVSCSQGQRGGNGWVGQAGDATRRAAGQRAAGSQLMSEMTLCGVSSGCATMAGQLLGRIDGQAGVGWRAPWLWIFFFWLVRGSRRCRSGCLCRDDGDDEGCAGSEQSGAPEVGTAESVDNAVERYTRKPFFSSGRASIFSKSSAAVRRSLSLSRKREKKKTRQKAELVGVWGWRETCRPHGDGGGGGKRGSCVAGEEVGGSVIAQTLTTLIQALYLLHL
ncbi:hypothetical protein IF2G_03677 [Cordyceps javanica]|nr:hypothetical protein IF2G_03677 [Cordyceps javanica]